MKKSDLILLMCKLIHHIKKNPLNILQIITIIKIQITNDSNGRTCFPG